MKNSKFAVRRSDCPVSFFLDLLGDKWTLLIIRDLLFNEKSTYTEFLDSCEGIASNILKDRLDLLIKEEIVIRRFSPNNSTRKFYFLTDKGVDLFPVISEIALWADTYGKPYLVEWNHILPERNADGKFASYRHKTILKREDQLQKMVP